MKQQKFLSAVIIAHNEEEHLEACMASIRFADEIVVVLDKCTDKSKEIAQKFADKIIEGSWAIEGERRNIGLDNCAGEWILEIDADQRISAALQAEILAAIKISRPAIFEAEISNFVGSRYIKYGWLRSFAVTMQHKVHYRGYKRYHQDKQIHPTADIKGEVKKLTQPVIHYMDKDIEDMIKRFNRYTSWKANDMIFKGKIKGNFASNFFSFLNRFFKAFVVKQGFREGGMGFLIALLAGLYPLVAYMKAKEVVLKR
jgi:glycosyltransferase involved in cell wall biosynthesis